MRDDRDGADVGQVGQGGRDLRQAVGFAVDAHDIRRGIELRDEGLPVADGGVDECDGEGLLRDGRRTRILGGEIGGKVFGVLAVVDDGRDDPVIGIQRLISGGDGVLTGVGGRGLGTGKIVQDVHLGGRDQQLGVEHVAGLEGAQAQPGFLGPTKAPRDVFQLKPFVGHGCSPQTRGHKPLGATPKDG